MYELRIRFAIRILCLSVTGPASSMRSVRRFGHSETKEMASCRSYSRLASLYTCQARKKTFRDVVSVTNHHAHKPSRESAAHVPEMVQHLSFRSG